MNTMKTIFSVLTLTLLATITGCTTTDQIHDKYTLSVRFRTRYNSDFTMSTPVTIQNKIFYSTKQNGDIRYKIMGALLPPHKGIYPLVITVSEWKTEAANSEVTTYKDMKLDRPVTHGVISSITSIFTITLSKDMNNNAEQAGPGYPPQGVGSPDP